MNLKVFKTEKELAEEVANFIIELIKSKPNAVLVLTSGDTPKKAYQLIAEYAEVGLFSQATIIGLDEWVGISPESEGSCKHIVEHYLLKPIKLSSENYTFFDSLSTDLNAECKRIDRLIQSKGGLDFVLVGIGQNGHLGLNEPGYSFEAYCQVTDLEEITIKTGQKYFNANTILNKGITVGLKHMLEAQALMIMANGSHKKNIINRVLTDEPNQNLPASIIKLHNNGMLWIDETAHLG